MKKENKPVVKLSFAEARKKMSIGNRHFLHLDAMGNTIEVGRYIVYSAAAGRSAVTKFGRVTALIPNKPATQSPKWETSQPAKIHAVTLDLWHDDGADAESHKNPDKLVDTFDIQNHGRPITIGMIGRVLVIPPSCLRSDVRSLLDSMFNNI